METAVFPGRLAVQQRVLPAYRAPFFDLLADLCQGGLSVFSGRPLPEENITPAQSLAAARLVQGHNRHWFHPGSPLYGCWQDGLLDWLDAWQPDVLVVEANPRYYSTPRAIRWMHARGRPVIGWGLGAPPVSGMTGILRRRSRMALLRSLDALVAYSRRGAEEYQALGFPGRQVFVAPNAVAPRPEKAPPYRPQSFDSRPVVLFIGRLQARKRIDHLLLACADLAEAVQPRLVIVGEGPARGDFERLAGKVYPRAEFTGALHGDALEPFFAAADIFVLPGTGGLAAQQAMGYGLPLIVAQGDGTQDDMVRTQEEARRGGGAANGWRIPPDDVQALRAALEEALSAPQKLRSMGAESYRRASADMNLQAMVEVFIRAANAVHERG